MKYTSVILGLRRYIHTFKFNFISQLSVNMCSLQVTNVTKKIGGVYVAPKNCTLAEFFGAKRLAEFFGAKILAEFFWRQLLAPKLEIFWR